MEEQEQAEEDGTTGWKEKECVEEGREEGTQDGARSRSC